MSSTGAALAIGTPVRIVGGGSIGATGTVLQRSQWRTCNARNFAGVLYHVQVDGTGQGVRCRGEDLAGF